MTTIHCHAATGPMNARLRVPGSKSITNRALAMAAWADGTSLLSNALFAEDTRLMVEGLRALGIRITVDEPGRAMEVSGCRAQLPVQEADIACGNAGTVLRFLTAMIATQRGEFRFDGNPRLRERPIGELTSALQSFGAGFSFAQREGFAPFTLYAAGLDGGHIQLTDPPSSQMVSALLLAAPYASADVFLEVTGDLPSRPYVHMTAALMEQFGVGIIPGPSGGGESWRCVIPASQRYQGQSLSIEPDASSASYFLAAAAVAGGSVTIEGLGTQSLQGDSGFVRVLEKMGCRIAQSENQTTVSRDSAARLHGIDVDLNSMPDMVPTLAVTALFAEGPTTIRNVPNLRIKESDRIAALALELRKLGAGVDELPDGLVIRPPLRLTPAELDSHDDHRLVMSFAVAALGCPGISIRNAECRDKSFPGFFVAWSHQLLGLA